MTVQVDLLEGMLRRHDWRKVAEFLVSSLGGSGFGTPGGEVNTLSSAGASRNVMDDGSGNASVQGFFSVTGSLGVGSAVNLGATLNIADGFRWGVSRKVTTTYPMVNDDSLIYADATAGAFTVTLNRNVVASGYTCMVKKIDSSANAVTVAPDHGTIDGAASLTLSTQYESAIFSYFSTGPFWYVLASNAGSIL